MLVSLILILFIVSAIAQKPKAHSFALNRRRHNEGRTLPDGSVNYEFLKMDRLRMRSKMAITQSNMKRYLQKRGMVDERELMAEQKKRRRAKRQETIPLTVGELCSDRYLAHSQR